MSIFLSFQKGEFTWDKSLQGGILGAFFWGYTVMQIPSGVLSERFGPRRMIFAGMLLVSVLTILTPVLARGSPYLLIVTRVLIGMGEVGLLFEEFYTVLSFSRKIILRYVSILGYNVSRGTSLLGQMVTPA